MKATQELDINIFAKRPTTAEDRERLEADFGVRDGGYKTIKCSFADPDWTAIFVECEDEKVSLSLEEASEAMDALYDLLPAKVAKSVNERLSAGTMKPYARKEGFSKDGAVLSHGIVFTTQSSGVRVTITR